MQNRQIRLLPQYKHCQTCSGLLYSPSFINDTYYYYCSRCQQQTRWTQNTRISKSKISYPVFEEIILCYVNKKSLVDTLQHLEDHFSGNVFNKNTICHYFDLFDEIALNYYEMKQNTTIFSGEIEIDESYLFKIKKTKAFRRRYGPSSCWLFGILHRETRDFLIIPVLRRDEKTLTPLILKHVAIGSTIFSDSFSTYVNNRSDPKESKLEPYGYYHQWVNHQIEFVAADFPHMHTNTIERLWGKIKTDFRKKNIKKINLYHIARFYFNCTLNRNQQLDILMKEIRQNH